MLRVLRFGVLALLAGVGLACQVQETKLVAAEGEKKGALVSIDGLSSRAPGDWKEEEATVQTRYKQFKLPKQGDDKAEAELVISFFGQGSGGGVDANIDRWKKQFEPPAGKSIDDVAKKEDLKIGEVKATYFDVSGTYLMKRRPFDPNEKPTPMPNYRMINIIFESPKGPYFFRLVGPEKTVTHHKKAFDEWLKNFK
jgi:hypothetical protein